MLHLIYRTRRLRAYFECFSRRQIGKGTDYSVFLLFSQAACCFLTTSVIVKRKRHNIQLRWEPVYLCRGSGQCHNISCRKTCRDQRQAVKSSLDEYNGSRKLLQVSPKPAGRIRLDPAAWSPRLIQELLMRVFIHSWLPLP